MTSSIDDLDQILPSAQGRPTAPRLVERIIDSYQGPDRVAIRRAFEDPIRYPATKLARWLRDHGHQISHQTISIWRAEQAHVNR